MVMLAYMSLILALAFAVGFGLYSLVNYQLAKASNRDGQFLSLLASMVGFGMTIAVVYLALVERLVAGM